MTRRLAATTGWCFALLALASACGGASKPAAGSGGTGGTGGTAGSISARAGAGGGESADLANLPSAAHTVAGVVTDIASGSRIEGATVSVVGSDTTAQTDAAGQFAFADLPEGSVSLMVAKDGYAPGYAAAQSAADAEAALVSLKKLGTQQSYDPTTPATLSEKTDNGPYAVTFSPNSLDTSDPDLTVTVTPLDPTTEAAALPGELVAGGSSPTPLQAVTFAEFGIVDSAGNRVQLKANASAIVELPIPIALRASYPVDSKIHCYSYDPTTAKWEDFVEGTVALSSVDKVTPVLRASIRHFSWYGGAPEIQDQDCALVKVVSKVTGKPLAGATISARPGLTAVSDDNGLAAITIEKGVAVTYTATKTYTDTYVDDAGNLIAQPGSKVIEFGRVEQDDELAPLTSGPCSGTESVQDGSNAVTVDTAPLPNGAYVYAISAIISSGQTEVILERGLPDSDGSPMDPEPVDGANITLRSEGGSTIALMSLSASLPAGVGATGLYTNPDGSDVPANGGERYTLSVDVDGNGSIDATASCSVPGMLTWISPQDGGSYASADFMASWSDSAADNPNYSVTYVAAFEGQSGNTLGAFYTGSERSFTPDPALAPDTYTATLQTVYSNATFSGVSVQGTLLCGASATEQVTFTIR